MFVDQSYILNGGLIVRSGAMLTIVNCNIYMNSTLLSTHTISVEDGAQLVIINSTIDRYGLYGFTFIVRGVLDVENCTISGMDYSIERTTSGIELYSAHARFDDIRLTNHGTMSLGLYLSNSTALVKDSNLYAEYSGIFMENFSSLTMENTTLATNINSGQGIVCDNSSLFLENCSFSFNSFGVVVISADLVQIDNCSFYRTIEGVVISSRVSTTAEIRGCICVENQWTALTLTGNTSVQNCIFLNNTIPWPIRSMASVLISRTMGDLSVDFSNCTFVQNHNGISARNATILLDNCSFLNNTRMSGFTGALLLPLEGDDDLMIRGCDFQDHPVGVEISSMNATAGYRVEESMFESNIIGIRSMGNLLDYYNNTFHANTIAIEERYFLSPSYDRNNFTDNLVDHRYMIQTWIRVEDEFKVPLVGAAIDLTSITEIDPMYNLISGPFGSIKKDIIVSEYLGIGTDSIDKKIFFPYELTCQYKGYENTASIENPDNSTVLVVIPYQRPVLKVTDLIIENTEFGVWNRDPRKDQQATISFRVWNTGKGDARNVTLIFRIDGHEQYRHHTSINAGKTKKFELEWTPEKKGKVNISVKVYDPEELNVSEKGPAIECHVGEDQSGYYYLIVIITIIVIFLMIWWMAANIEGADEIMADFARNLKNRLADILESLAGKLRVEDLQEEPEIQISVPSGTITMWDGQQTLNGSGKYLPWSIIEENIRKSKRQDVMTVEIEIPAPDVEFPVDDGSGMETFEWITNHGEKQQIKVDRRTLSQISHPKVYICSLCDRNFVSIDPRANCPWCNGKAIFLQDM